MIDNMWNVKSESMESKADVDVFAPAWSCHPYKLAVSVEALTRKVMLPTIKLLDGTKCVMSSVLHKELCTEWNDYTLIRRFWSVVTTDPASAKSPALNTVLHEFEFAMTDESVAGVLPGNRGNKHHVITQCTHAACSFQCSFKPMRWLWVCGSCRERQHRM